MGVIGCITKPNASPLFDIVVGVDTHKDVPVAVAIDQLGRNLGLCEPNVSSSGYRAVEMWAQTLGRAGAFSSETWKLPVPQCS